MAKAEHDIPSDCCLIIAAAINRSEGKISKPKNAYWGSGQSPFS